MTPRQNKIKQVEADLEAGVALTLFDVLEDCESLVRSPLPLPFSLTRARV